MSPQLNKIKKKKVSVKHKDLPIVKTTQQDLIKILHLEKSFLLPSINRLPSLNHVWFCALPPKDKVRCCTMAYSV